MKNLILLLLMVAAFPAAAQQVPRQAVVEHFTNSWCSVCAGRNPGFFENLSQARDVLHLSIYPSAPYRGCPLSQYNATDQDARTHFYGVYGGTPRLVVNGDVVAAGADYSSAAIFSNARSQTSAFELRASLQKVDSQNAELRYVVYKRDTSRIDSIMLYALVTQDTIDFPAKNGEAHHYNVFRKSVWGKDPIAVQLPTNVGDSIVATRSFSIAAEWDLRRISATVLAQHRDGKLEQAARSNPLMAASMGMNPGTPTGGSLIAYPNPAGARLFISTPGYARIRIRDLAGRILIDEAFIGTMGTDIGKLSTGIYVYSLDAGTERLTGRFFKR